MSNWNYNIPYRVGSQNNNAIKVIASDAKRLEQGEQAREKAWREANPSQAAARNTLHKTRVESKKLLGSVVIPTEVMKRLIEERRMFEDEIKKLQEEMEIHQRKIKEEEQKVREFDAQISLWNEKIQEIEYKMYGKRGGSYRKRKTHRKHKTHCKRK